MAELLGYPSRTYDLQQLMSPNDRNLIITKPHSYSPVPSAESSPSPPLGMVAAAGGSAVAAAGSAAAGAPRRRRRARTLFDEEALSCLEKAFALDRYPDINRREELATQIGVPEARVQTWFQNKRSRMRRDSRQQLSPGDRSSDGHDALLAVPSIDTPTRQRRKLSPDVSRDATTEDHRLNASPRSEDDHTPPGGPRKNSHRQTSRRPAYRSPDEGLGSMPSTPDRASWTPATGFFPFSPLYAPKMNLAEGRSYLEPVSGMFPGPLEGLSPPGLPFPSYLTGSHCRSPAQLVPSLQLPFVHTSPSGRGPLLPFPPLYLGPQIYAAPTAVHTPPSVNDTNQRHQGALFRPVDFTRLSHSEEEDVNKPGEEPCAPEQSSAALDLRMGSSPDNQSSPRSENSTSDQHDSGAMLDGSPPSSGYLSDDIDVCN